MPVYRADRESLLLPGNIPRCIRRIVLALFDPRLAQIAELRLFTGLTVKEMASDLHAAESSIREKWHVAEAWLRRDES